MKKVFIHIGDAKTGTSSIQKSLDESYDRLLERGWLYPLPGRPEIRAGVPGDAHHKFAKNYNSSHRNFHQNPALSDATIESFEESGANNLLLSSEGFCSYRNIDDIERLKSIFSDYEVRIIGYLRRPDLWIESWYPQAVKGRPFAKITFEEYLKKGTRPALNTVKNYVSIFGRKNCHLREFRRDGFVEKSLIADFSSIIGVDCIPEVSDEVNITPGKAVVEFIRQLNSKYDLATRKRVALNQFLIGAFSSDDKPCYMNSTQRSEYLSQFSDLIHFFDENFGDGSTFFDMELGNRVPQELDGSLNISFDNVFSWLDKSMDNLLSKGN